VQSPLPNFRRSSVVAKRLHASRCHLPLLRASGPVTLASGALEIGLLYYYYYWYGGRSQPRGLFCVRWGLSPLNFRPICLSWSPYVIGQTIIFLPWFLSFFFLFGRPFVKRFTLCYRSVVCLSCLSVCLSVTLVYCGQTVGRIKIKLGV